MGPTVVELIATFISNMRPAADRSYSRAMRHGSLLSAVTALPEFINCRNPENIAALYSRPAARECADPVVRQPQGSWLTAQQ
jgi:hypothetical protein